MPIRTSHDDCGVVTSNSRRHEMINRRLRKKINRIKIDSSDEWNDAVSLFEEWIGGVSIDDLERGDEYALQTAQRSMRKKVLELMTADIEKRGPNE